MFNAQKNYELNVLISGKPITEYDHEGNVFVEGRKGSDFEIEFRNKTGKQVLVVPSVDGKSVFDGKPATSTSRGYIVGAWGVVRIPGWTLDNNAVANFTFADKDASYSAAVTEAGDPVITGVIGVLVFSEKPKPVLPVIHHYHPTYPTMPYDPWNSPRAPWWNLPLGGSVSNNAAPQDNVMRSASRRVQAGSGVFGKSAGIATANSATLSASSVVDSAAASDSFDMGTGFGQKSEFKVTQTTFERDALEATMLIYYDSRRNLEKRGIQVVKRETRYLNELPQAFAGQGCQPPAGWKG